MPAIYKDHLQIDYLCEESKEFVIRRAQDGISYKSISSMVRLSIANLRTIINEHKFFQKEIKRKERQQRLPFKIISEHLLHAQNYLDQNSTKLISG